MSKFTLSWCGPLIPGLLEHKLSNPLQGIFFLDWRLAPYVKNPGLLDHEASKKGTLATNCNINGAFVRRPLSKNTCCRRVARCSAFWNFLFVASCGPRPSSSDVGILAAACTGIPAAGWAGIPASGLVGFPAAGWARAA